MLARSPRAIRQLLLMRALLGVALGGMPAHRHGLPERRNRTGPSLGHSMGLYIGGSAFGGMTGRVLTSVHERHFYDWRIAVGRWAAWPDCAGLGVLAQPAGVAAFRGGRRRLARTVHVGIQAAPVAMPACPGCLRCPSC
jgi:hypothetical protein